MPAVVRFTWHELSLFSADQRPELIEQILAVVRAGGGLGVVLDAEDRQPLVPQALEGLVVQVDVAGLDVGGQRGRIDGEAVVLGGDLDLAGSLVADRVIGAAVAELELEGLAAEGLAEESDGPGRCRRSGCRATRRPCGSGSGASAVASDEAPGSPGPLERKMPSG